MLSRDSVSSLHHLTRLRVRPSATAISHRYLAAGPGRIVVTSNVQQDECKQCQVRLFATSSYRPQQLDAALGSTSSPLDDIHISQTRFPSGASADVRQYLKKWSTGHQQYLKANAPSEVKPGRNMSLPNSLFVRNDTEDEVVEEIDISVDEHESQYEEVAVAARLLRPGDAFRIDSLFVRTQFALYLGQHGVQSQYLLADGRWFVDTQSNWRGHIIHDFASDQEMSRVRSHLPVKIVETEAESGARHAVHAVGEVPSSDCSSILARFTLLAEAVEDYKRELARPYEQMYMKSAAEAEFRTLPLPELLTKHLDLKSDSLTDAAEMVIHSRLINDERYHMTLSRDLHIVTILPKRMFRATQNVTSWAREYQDAAARAASGKDVSQELQSNPLTGFISKARRLIAKSRKFRSPTDAGHLGPTIESEVPASGTVERRSTGEIFSKEEKEVIEFLWLNFVKKPLQPTPALRRNNAVGALILRAVGAYPKHQLNTQIGQLFLQELGCLDPWFTRESHHATLPLYNLGLNETARTLKEREQAAIAELGLRPGAIEPPFPDQMAELRKDWGETEVFCIDNESTRIVDDGISIEPAETHPNHYWLHVHIAHPSAFIPPDHVFHEQAVFMGGAYYANEGIVPCYPFELSQTLSMAPNRPVITCSTLLSSDGEVKDVNVTAGTVKNVININHRLLNDTIRDLDPTANVLSVGSQIDPRDSEPDITKSAGNVQTFAQSRASYWKQQHDLVQTHMPKFKLIQSLGVARWNARQREEPDYLRLVKPRPAHEVTSLIRYRPSDQDLHHDRIFRSEHCYGDPSISVRGRLISLTETFDDARVKHDVVHTAMLLSGESLGLWTRARGIPVIYRFAGYRSGWGSSKLNHLGPYEPYLGLALGESIDPVPNVALNVAQHVVATSPLRRPKDMINYYQIDAYLKAQAAAQSPESKADLKVDYPYSREELLNFIHEGSTYKELQTSGQVSETHWKMYALFRAFHFNETKLPGVWDVALNNPVTVGTQRDQITGTLMGLDLPVVLDDPEDVWRKHGRFRQFLPVKIQRVDFRNQKLYCIAVGPPSDTPQHGPLYPELSSAQASISGAAELRTSG